MSFPIFRLEKIDLIELTNKHLENLLEVYSDDRVTEFMDIHSMKTLEEVNKEWVLWAENQFTGNTGIRWGILHKEKIIGTCGFHNIHKEERKKMAEIGYDLKYEYWGEGLFSEILPIIMKYAFSELHIDEIHALIYPENIRSKKMIVKQGFCFQKIIQLDEPCKNRFSEEELYIYLRKTSCIQKS